MAILSQQDRNRIIAFLEGEKRVWGEGEYRDAAIAEIDSVIADFQAGGVQKAIDFLETTAKANAFLASMPGVFSSTEFPEIAEASHELNMATTDEAEQLLRLLKLQVQ